MRVLILKNIAAEGPGTIGEFLAYRGIRHSVVDLSRGEPVPPGAGFDALVMMGGPMSVNDEEIYPYLVRERELVAEFIAADKRVLGVCLGAQIMAKALGAPVYPGAEKEIGWYSIEITAEGMHDPMMRTLAGEPRVREPRGRIEVFQWHGETFDMPAGAVGLARSALFPNQAFRFGPRAYAFQFHIEVTREMIGEWLRNEEVDLEEVSGDTDRYFDSYHLRARRFYDAFFCGGEA